MTLHIPSMIVSGMVALVLSVTLTLLIVLSTGAEWGGESADPKVQRCYDLMIDFWQAEADSPAEDRVWEKMTSDECFY